MDVVEYPWRIGRESDPGEGHFPAVSWSLRVPAAVSYNLFASL
jgi:hypothetical protein